MSPQHARRVGRREFLGGLTLAGAAGCLGVHPRPVAAEPPPETRMLRLAKGGVSICQAPQILAELFLQEEGFTEVQHVTKESIVETYKALASGEIDLGGGFGASLIIRLEAGDPIVILGGQQVGCFELFGTDRVQTIRDLKGKTVAVLEFGGVEHVFLASIVAYVGLDPRKDINWVFHSPAESIRLLAEGQVDAFLAFPPRSQEVRAKQIGHVVLNSIMDRPWSQYFCCVLAGNREFVRKHPVATKRWLRAVLKAADFIAREPEQAARFIVANGYTPSFDYALETVRMIPYGKWRDYDPEDTLRFYALRLHESGMIKSTPQKLIAQGTDWRFFNELKKELKG